MQPKFRFDNMDAAESAFLSRQLEEIRARTYDIKLQQLKARELIPVDGSISPGAETVTYRQYEPTGVAKIVSNYANDFPRADVVAREFTGRIRSLGDSYGYNVQEARAAQFSGVPLDQKRANAARRAIEEKLDQIAKSGDSKHGLLGLLNQPNTSTYVVPNGAGGQATFASKTPDEIVADMHGIALGMVTSTKEVEIPDTLLLPLTQYGRVATKRMGDGSDTTILDFFKKTSPYIKEVIPWSALAGAGAGGTDRMVCYRRDPDVLQLIVPQEFEQFPPQQEGMEVVTHCHMRTGGVVVYYPLAISYGDGI